MTSRRTSEQAASSASGPGGARPGGTGTKADAELEPLLARARAWQADDPDPVTRDELGDLIAAAQAGDAGAVAELRDRFGGFLRFGTAGLRGALGAGPNRMNRVVVIRAAAGLAAYLNDRGGGSVVIGFDARTNSDVFAADSAEVLAGAGLRALLLPRPLPTPVLAYAIRALGCAAGVMVTASHNPAQDNGYKVYLGDGSQIVPPADAEISAAIDAVGPVREVPRSADVEHLDDRVLDAYLDRVTSLPRPGGPRALRIAYTPMHGVGGAVVARALERAGFETPAVVTEQAEPDPAFPTVEFPNPEEPGAMDRALALGREVRADVVLANDPDADRLAVAVPVRDRSAAPAGAHTASTAGGESARTPTSGGGDPATAGTPMTVDEASAVGNGERSERWRMLTGDEVGALLAVHLIRSGARGTLACSIVSSSLLSVIARRHGLRFEPTLTGFKWIGRVPDLVFGYEEALGYCVDPAAVADKDGVSALLRLAELAAALKAEGRTLLDLLDEIAVEYGLHATRQLSLRVSDLRQATEVLARFREAPPTELGGRRVERFDDLARPEDHLPPTDGVRYLLAGGARVVVRPSGTEPKLKCYLEVVSPVERETLADARAAAEAELSAIESDLAAFLP